MPEMLRRYKAAPPKSFYIVLCTSLVFFESALSVWFKIQRQTLLNDHLQPFLSAPHSAHAGANVDAWPLARGTRRCTDYRQRPGRPLEEPEQTIRNEPGSGRIYVAVALRMLAMCKEPLRHD